MVRIPETSGEAFDFAAVEPTAVDAASFAAAGERPAVGADELVRFTEIFAEPEVEIAELGRLDGESGQSVMRIIALRLKPDHLLLFIHDAVAVFVDQAEDRVSARNPNRTVGMGCDSHRVLESIGEDVA